MEHFQQGLKDLLIFPEVISDYGFAQIHSYFSPGIHGNINDTSLRGVMAAIKGGFLDAKQAGLCEVQIPTPGLIRTSHYQAERTNPGNEQFLCKTVLCLLLFEFCKRSNTLLKFSQDSINLELAISSQFTHFLGRLGQQSHKCTVFNLI